MKARRTAWRVGMAVGAAVCLAGVAAAADTGVYLDTINGTSALKVFDAVSNELMRVQSDGKAGVKMAPTYELDVNGTVRATNFIGDGSQLSNLTAASAVPDLSNVVWVALNGTNTNPGTIDKPVYPPQAGHDLAAAKFGAAGSVVLIAGGTYPVGINVWGTNVHVMGLGKPELQTLVYSGTHPAGALQGRKVTLQNLTFGMGGVFNGTDLKCLNCRFESSSNIRQGGDGYRLEFQNCFFRNGDEGVGAALTINPGAMQISLNNCGLQADGNEASSIALDVKDNVSGLSVQGCELVNNTINAPVIMDGQQLEIDPVHLYTHNHIKSGFVDPAPVKQNGTAIQSAGSWTIAFHNNTVHGFVGTLQPGPFAQYVANNMVAVYGNPGGSAVRWNIAPGAPTQDAGFNVTYPYHPKTPDPWDD